MVSIITISSLRGGVGKTTFALELALYLSLKAKVLLLDADFYSPQLLLDVNSRKGNIPLKPKAYIRDVFRGLYSIEESCVAVSPTLHAIFSDPNVNLWELSKDVGNKNFWIEDEVSIPSQAEKGFAKLKEYVNNNLYEFLIFDTMGSLSYPMLYLNYISTHSLYLSQPSLPQLKYMVDFINLIARTNQQVSLVWSNVPIADNFMSKARQSLEEKLREKCSNKFNIIGLIPRDPEFEQNALCGELNLFPGRAATPYYEGVRKIAQLMN
ncbi:MAG: AAA family ATPase [Candidatus Odinarchaeota archaeon]